MSEFVIHGASLVLLTFIVTFIKSLWPLAPLAVARIQYVFMALLLSGVPENLLPVMLVSQEALVLMLHSVALPLSSVNFSL